MRRIFSGIPAYFRAHCQLAAACADGITYATAGYNLTIHLFDLVPHSQDEGWMTELARLDQLLDNQEFDLATSWFVEHFPSCLSLVPSRRRQKFIEGAYEGWKKERRAWAAHFADASFLSPRQ